jgi:hypothetical protein
VTSGWTVRVWDLQLKAGQETIRDSLTAFEDRPHREVALRPQVTPDGRYVVSGFGDESLRVWQVERPPSAVFDVHWRELVHRLRGHTQPVTGFAMSADGHWIVSASLDRTIRVWELDWEYEFPEPADWDKGARPYLENFLTLHTPSGPDGLSRVGTPAWSEADFEHLLAELGLRGYGWLRPAGVRRKLAKLAARRAPAAAGSGSP